MLAVKAHILKKSTLSGAAAQAADTNGDSGISITDFIQLKAHILEKSNVEPKSITSTTVKQVRTAVKEVEVSEPATKTTTAPVTVVTYVATDVLVPEKKVILSV